MGLVRATRTLTLRRKGNEPRKEKRTDLHRKKKEKKRQLAADMEIENGAKEFTQRLKNGRAAPGGKGNGLNKPSPKKPGTRNRKRNKKTSQGRRQRQGFPAERRRGIQRGRQTAASQSMGPGLSRLSVLDPLEPVCQSKWQRQRQRSGKG